MINETQKNDITHIYTTITWIAAVMALTATIVFFVWWGMKDRIEFGNEKFD